MSAERSSSSCSHKCGPRSAESGAPDCSAEILIGAERSDFQSISCLANRSRSFTTTWATNSNKASFRRHGKIPERPALARSYSMNASMVTMALSARAETAWSNRSVPWSANCGTKARMSHYLGTKSTYRRGGSTFVEPKPPDKLCRQTIY
jgi:hypothetical protein